MKYDETVRVTWLINKKNQYGRCLFFIYYITMFSSFSAGIVSTIPAPNGDMHKHTIHEHKG